MGSIGDLLTVLSRESGVSENKVSHKNLDKSWNSFRVGNYNTVSNIISNHKECTEVFLVFFLSN